LLIGFALFDEGDYFLGVLLKDHFEIVAVDAVFSPSLVERCPRLCPHSEETGGESSLPYRIMFKQSKLSVSVSYLAHEYL
jgi:hypothetical protein